MAEKGKSKSKYVKAAVLRELTQFDPELAEELATSEEPIERIIARELAFVKMLRVEKLKEIDLETLMVAFDFWNKIMELAFMNIERLSRVFMVNFLNEYEYIAQAVMAKLQSGQPTAREKYMELVSELVRRAVESFDNMLKAQQNLVGGGKVEEEKSEDRAKTGRRRSSKKLSTRNE